MQNSINYWLHFVYYQVLNASYETQLNRLKANIFTRLFYKIIKLSDPLISYKIAGFDLLFPFSHQLPFILKTYPLYSSNLARLAKYVKEKYKHLKFIDVGANIGDSIALLRKEAEFPILCIEGDEQFLSVLEKNATFFSEVHIVQAYLGESSNSIRGTAIKQGGTAHLSENMVGENIIEVKKLSDVLKDYPSFCQSKMIKVDTDGFDCKILRGAADFLKSAKPIIFFEYDPFFLAEQGDNGTSIFDDLSNYGYKNLLIYDNFGDLMLSANINNYRLLEELHLYFSGRLGHRYCDICVFHTEDSDLFEIAREREIQFFENIRGIKSGDNAYSL
ncbi:FkbM family methyltransferase [Microcoleus sp. FACHB-53]|nr:FkbM family methyltransferase [Microcoleus sp. FACHB-53]